MLAFVYKNNYLNLIGDLKIQSQNLPLDTIDSSAQCELSDDENNQIISGINFLDLLILPAIGEEHFSHNNNCSYGSTAKFIEMQEEFLNCELLGKQENLIVWEECQGLPSNNETAETQELSNLILTTSQPFIITPLDKNYYQDLQRLLPESADRPTLNQNNNLSLEYKEEIRDQNLTELAHPSLFYMIQEVNNCSITFNNQFDVEKYEALSSAVHNQVVDQISFYSLKDKDTIEITLYPDSLGTVKIKCEVGEKIVIDVSSDKFSTLSLLQHNALELKEIISHNIVERSQEMEMNFNMAKDNGNNNNHSESHLEQNRAESNIDYQSNISMHFSHNGVINFIV